MNCELHNVAMVEKTGQYGTYYSHMIQNVGFCDGKKIKPFKQPQQVQGVQPAAQAFQQPATKKHDTMLMCNAMNNAVSLASHGIIQISEVEAYFNKILTALESKN